MQIGSNIVFCFFCTIHHLNFMISITYKVTFFPTRKTLHPCSRSFFCHCVGVASFPPRSHQAEGLSLPHTSCVNPSVPTPSRIWSADVSAPACSSTALLYAPAAKVEPVQREPASMAAKRFYRQGLLLLLFNFISTAALEKRFSDFKRCADQECSSKFAVLL